MPNEIRSEQMEAIRLHKPPFAIIAGGRPDQAKELETQGIPTYLHVPSPGLLRMFLKDGARRFIFEGQECGGHRERHEDHGQRQRGRRDARPGPLSIGERKPQPPASFLCRETRLEDAGKVAFGNALPCVGDVDKDPVLVAPQDLDGNCTGAAHSVDTVFAQVLDHPFEQWSVYHGSYRLGKSIEFEVYSR